LGLVHAEASEYGSNAGMQEIDDHIVYRWRVAQAAVALVRQAMVDRTG
jgi:hypothetical protein